jgi:hypothetical protein
MKSLVCTLFLWLVLAVLTCLMASPADGDMHQLAAVCGLFVLPPLAVWLTAKAAASLPERWVLRAPFWAVTLGGWLAAVLLAQGRAESSQADLHQSVVLACGLTALTAGWLAVKARAFPTWRGLREVAAGVAVLTLAGGLFAWSYEERTRALFVRAEARWSEIGRPMAEFEKTLAPTHENAGSEITRQVLREQVGTRFYKEGTAAADREPVAELTHTKDGLIQRACDIVSAKLPPSDALDLTTIPDSRSRVRAVRNNRQTGAPNDDPAPPPLEEAFTRILAAEPPMWASDPHDGYTISVPNFLGVRKFSQLTAAEAMRRFADGDEAGAARALTAGLRVSQSLRENPTLVSLMIHIAVDALLAPRQVRLPATADGLAAVARDVPVLRAEFLRRLQLEAWWCLHGADQMGGEEAFNFGTSPLPKWARRFTNQPRARRECALGALVGAEHIAITQSPATLALPDFGADLHDAIDRRQPTILFPNFNRAAMRIHATLLLREQTELIRDARARLAAGRPVESRDSAVLPGVRWELTADAQKNTVATRLAGAPDWIVKGDITGNDGFWLLPLDGSVAWQFYTPARTAGRF